MSSSERLLGDFLLTCIPRTVPDETTLDGTVELITFAHDVTFFVKQFQTQLSQSKQAETGELTPIGAEDCIPGLACLMYDAISVATTSPEEQLKRLVDYSARINQINTLLHTFTTPLQGTSVQSHFETPKNHILNAESEPSAIVNFSMALDYLIRRTQLSIKNTDQVLHPEDLNSVLQDAQKQSFTDELREHFSVENQDRLKETIRIRLKTSQSEDESKEDVQKLRAISEKNSKKLKPLIAFLKKLIKDNKIIIASLIKNSKGRKKYHELNEAIKKYSEDYKEKLSEILNFCEEHSVDENTAVFIQKKWKELHDETELFSQSQNNNIELLDKTRSNWFLQKLSDLTRKFFEYRKKPLPNWRWLHNKNSALLKALFEKINDTKKNLDDTPEDGRPGAATISVEISFEQHTYPASPPPSSQNASLLTHPDSQPTIIPIDQRSTNRPLV